MLRSDSIPLERITIRRADAEEARLVASILREAAGWLEDRGMPLWREEELRLQDIAEHVQAGLYFLAEAAGEVAGTFRLQLEDPEFWPQVRAGESLFLHRFAVRRRFAGRGIAAGMLECAAEHAQHLGLRYLRLDCDAVRPRLRAVYEASGFRYHSDWYFGDFLVARYERDLLTQPPLSRISSGGGTRQRSAGVLGRSDPHGRGSADR